MEADGSDPVQGLMDFSSPRAGQGATIVRMSAKIMEGPPDKPEFLHAGLCQVGLPRSPTNATTFERKSGKASLLLEAGKLWDGNREEWVQQPLPWGTRPRLALVHVSSEAIRTRNPSVTVGASAREFLLKLGIDTGGKEYKTFSAQMSALAACHLSLGFGSETLNAKPIKRFSSWLNPLDRPAALNPGVIELSPEFFDSLLEKAVPLDPRALSALKQSALALDVYAWLAHRLHRVRPISGTFLSWDNLMEQFGQEYADPRSFRKEFANVLKRVMAVYPTGRINKSRGGIVLLPSPSPIPKTSVVVQVLTRS